MNVFSNAVQVAKRVGRIAKRWDLAALRGLRRIATKVDEKQVENLSGSNSAEPGSYPVPNRTGNLMRGRFFKVPSPSLAFVGNTTVYAPVIHREREFLQDASDDVDATAEMQHEIRKVAMAP
ncbi:MAG: hypothetical protein HUJ30_02405 [Gammaproteobacteria bacterium]|nr:hypothetical protein [Gammaproteobacteria bacterium]